MFTRTLLLLLLIWGQDSVWSVRLVELRVPAHAQEGGSALLGCQYDLEGEDLYSVKWYKDGDEFYRYVPKNYPPSISFWRPGVHVNITRSSNTVVVLENLTRKSEGDYMCEVSGEAPSFTTVRNFKHITVNLLPESGPHVTGLRDQYYLDELAVINCTSSASRPVAHLEWLVNDQPAAPQDLQGPWYRVVAADAVEITLQMRFIVKPKHFVGSTMRIKCQATIAPLYQRETKSEHYVGLPFTNVADSSTLQVKDTGFDAATDSGSKQTKAAVFLFTVLPLIMFQIV